MREYARERTAKLLGKLGDAIKVAEQKAEADAIHDVRVAIRRLKRCLKVFAPFYPDGYWKKISEKLSNLMQSAGAARDCDIAIELLGEAGVSRRAGIVKKLVVRRERAGQDLAGEIRRWQSRHYLRKWKSRLDL